MNSTRQGMGQTKTAALMIATVFAVAAVAGASSAIDGTIRNIGDGTTGLTTVNHIYFSVRSAGTIGIDLMSWEWLGDPRLGGGLIDLNRDGEFAYVDTQVYLFADDGSLDAGDLLAGNDNMTDYLGGGLSDGSLYLTDSYLAPTLGVGDYILAVGSARLSVDDAIMGVNPDSKELSSGTEQPSDHGDYRVVFSGDVNVVGGSLPGDTNLDGVVDELDIATLMQNWHSSGTWADGDFNGDGYVDERDAAEAALDWLLDAPTVPTSSGVSGPSGVVPEPLTMLAVLGAAASVGGYVRRRRAVSTRK